MVHADEEIASKLRMLYVKAYDALVALQEAEKGMFVDGANQHERRVAEAHALSMRLSLELELAISAVPMAVVETASVVQVSVTEAKGGCRSVSAKAGFAGAGTVEHVTGGNKELASSKRCACPIDR